MVTGIAGCTVASGSGVIPGVVDSARGAAADTPLPAPSTANAPVATIPQLVGSPSTPLAAAPSSGSPAGPTNPETEPSPITPAPAADSPAVPVPAPEAAAPPAAPAPAPAPPTTVDPPYNTALGWHGTDRVAYLSFDDGPGPYTGRVLDVLAAAGVKATFCEVGQKVTENPTLVQRVVAEGHTLCNHSWDHHSPFDALSAADIDSEINQTQQAMMGAVDATARYFRAPEGRFGPADGQVLLACQRARTIPLAWGVDSLDWKKPGAAAIVANVLTTVTPGAVILMHDGGGADREQTVAALPGIIAGLQAAGYTLAALPADPAG